MKTKELMKLFLELSQSTILKQVFCENDYLHKNKKLFHFNLIPVKQNVLKPGFRIRLYMNHFSLFNQKFVEMCFCKNVHNVLNMNSLHAG